MPQLICVKSGGWKMVKLSTIYRDVKNSFIILMLILVFQIKGVNINSDIEFLVGNESYILDQNMEFSSITIDSSYIVFNSTGFYITSGNDIDITLVYLKDDIASSIDGDKILEFYASTTGGNVWFNISGFPEGVDYIVNRSGITIQNSSANNSGFISFTNNIWSSHLFTIIQNGAGAADFIPPVISEISIIKSCPLDSDPSFGWENISCKVTDNNEVEEVCLNLILPDSSINNITMTEIENSYYSYNTSLTQYGNYSYYIWTKDTSNNTDISNLYDLSIPPNWDINNDGVVNVFDHVLTSNHYGETNSPGWIREDIDNNGEIQVFDLVLVSNHYGEIWWEE